MSSIMHMYWLNEDHREWLACVRYILFKCCKKAKSKYRLGKDVPNWESSIETEYIPIGFLDFKWIADRCNFEMAKKYGLEFIPNSFIHWHEDSKFVPEYFNADFTCEYKKQKNGKLKKCKAKHQSFEKDFLSGADVYTIKKIVRRWKLYGRWCVKIADAYYRLKWKIKNIYEKDL